MATEPHTWLPILTGDSAEQALRVVHEIADGVDQAAATSHGLSDGHRLTQQASLGRGGAGTAVLFAYLSSLTGKADDRDRALSLLNDAIETVGSTDMTPSLYGGFAGVAWSIAHLHSRLDPDTRNSNAAIDEALSDYLSRSPWPHDFDLIDGLVGLGVYALEQLPDAIAIDCLEKVIDRLEEMRETTEDGITWCTRPEFLPVAPDGSPRRGRYDLGVAHGVPGVIAFLAQTIAAGVAARRATDLLEGAVSWLLKQRLPAAMGSVFSYSTGPGDDRPPARAAWCYGDPGIAIALLYAARAVGKPAWEKEAIAIAHTAATRSLADSGVVDAGLCHGAAGLGHIFNRLWQASGEPLLKERSIFWFDQVLHLRNPGRGVAGYPAWKGSRAGGGGEWVADPGFLSGATGVALALLAAATPQEPLWDRVLLLSGGGQRA